MADNKTKKKANDTCEMVSVRGDVYRGVNELKDEKDKSLRAIFSDMYAFYVKYHKHEADIKGMLDAK